MIKLKSLALKNFKGVRKFELNLEGQNATVYGENATGKTTLYDAFLWLLFDKDSLNRSNFGIKTLDEDGQVINGLDHEVEAILDVDGKSLSLRKVYYEKWTKTRGSAKKVFSGHTTDYYIDDVPIDKKKDFERKIEELADEKIFRLLTDPRFFNEQLHWEERRNMLLEICGDITDKDVIASDKKLSKLSEVLGSRTIDDHKTVIASKRKEINKQIERIPIRIDEVHNNMPDIEGLDFENIQKEIDELSFIQDVRRKTLSRTESGGEVAQKEKELAQLETERIKLESAHDEKKRGALGGIRDKTYELSTKRGGKKSELMQKESRADFLKAKIISMEHLREGLLQEWHKENEKTFEIVLEDVCPTCSQSIPVSQLEEARDKALKSFNLEKSKKLEGISSEGKELAAELAEHKIEYNSLTEECEEREKELEVLKHEITELDKQIAVINTNYGDVDSIPECQALLKEISRINHEIEELKAGSKDEADKIKKNIAEIGVEIRELQSELAKDEQYKKAQTRIKELESKEEALAKELEELDEQLYLTEEFTKTKVNLLESSINNKFKMARFKMFEVQVNGGIKEVCETVFDGVPYSDLNNAARINIGLDIINTLSEHYNFSAPIFVDNRESVTKLTDVNAQVISLVVSEPDKKLRVELEDEKLKEAI